MGYKMYYIHECRTHRLVLKKTWLLHIHKYIYRIVQMQKLEVCKYKYVTFSHHNDNKGTYLYMSVHTHIHTHLQTCIYTKNISIWLPSKFSVSRLRTPEGRYCSALYMSVHVDILHTCIHIHTYTYVSIKDYL